ncbi:uncharacterized protein BDW70DRAFT_9689 [Aspergillus foveolatus]|uniref:uncharacterized protein n=1 Tax=Aspergillus foveolatus TaxID=210207 RepID=UPI003CCDBBBB
MSSSLYRIRLLPHALFPTLVITSTNSSDSHADVQYAGTARRDPRRSRLTLKLEPARLSPESADGVIRVPTICRWRVSRGIEANEGLYLEQCILCNHIGWRAPALQTGQRRLLSAGLRRAVRVLRRW